MTFKLGDVDFEVQVATSTRSKWPSSLIFFTRGAFGIALLFFKVKPRMVFRGTSGIPHVPPLFFKELAKLCLEVLDLSLEFGFVTLFRCEASRHGSMRVGNGVFRVGGGWHGRARGHGLTVRLCCLRWHTVKGGTVVHLGTGCPCRVAVRGSAEKMQGR